LTFFYLAVSSGVAMEIHYCMGKKAGVDIYQTSENNKCSRCGMKDKKGGCCKDEHKFFKLSTDQQFTSNDHHHDVPFVAIQHEYCIFNIEGSLPVSKSTLRNNSPPGGTGTPIYIRHCNFRL
jgi:hypothetical protein